MVKTKGAPPKSKRKCNYGRKRRQCSNYGRKRCSNRNQTGHIKKKCPKIFYDKEQTINNDCLMSESSGIQIDVEAPLIIF